MQHFQNQPHALNSTVSPESVTAIPGAQAPESLLWQGASLTEARRQYLRAPFANRGKRLFDVAVSSVLLALLFPLMAIVALLVKSTSPGPILFRQERVGQWGKRFDLYKFRSMRVDAEKDTGPVWATQHDDRTTPLGGMLRATHLDELPQLWNVLRGEMSLVGPRPERPCFVRQFIEQGIDDYHHRHLIRPGITGYAQVVCGFPTLEEIHLKTQADIFYLRQWSAFLDLWILWKTALRVLKNVQKLDG